MKQFSLSLFLASLLLLQGCSKDFLKRYDKRVVGTWRIASIKSIGIGGGTDGLPFREGPFTFEDDGTLLYRNGTGQVFSGRWDIEKNYVDDDGTKRSLQLTAVNFNTQEVLSEYYDDMTFVGTDHFRATMSLGYKTYITHFRR